MSSGLHCYARLDTSAEVGDRKGDGITGTVTCPELDLSGRKELRYAILFDKSGKVTDYVATDGTYYLNYHGSELRIEDITSSSAGAKIPTEVVEGNLKYKSSPLTYALTDGNDATDGNKVASYSKATISVTYGTTFTATITPQ